MHVKSLVSLVLVSIIGFSGWLFFKREIGSISIPKKEIISETSTKSEHSLGFTIPEGFEISIFAKDIPNARVMALDPQGRMLVSQPKQGNITILSDVDNDGISEQRKILVSGLLNPHGMAFQCTTASTCLLYVAESNALTQFSYNTELGSVSDKTKLVDLPYSKTDRHTTRTLLFLGVPDENTLLISVGSSCNVCVDREGRGKILAYDTKTKKVSEYAHGLRNSVFMALHPVSGDVWATEMGRDGLGDDIPPDEINVIFKGKNYGWPICYGKNIHDTEFDKNTYIRSPCMEPFETGSHIDLQAHSAPLGIAFIPEEGWPEEYWFDALVAYHGSWNRSDPTGYKIDRIKLNKEGNSEETEDFISGWLTKDGTKTGRPVDLLVLSGGVLYVSDDSAGVIYRLSRK